MKTSSNQLPKYSWNKAATPLIADSQGLELSDGSLVGWVERSETQQRFYDVLTSPPNISTIFLTRAGNIGTLPLLMQFLDPKDDHILELAVASGTSIIVTYNAKDFKGIASFGVRSITPKELMEEIL